MEMEVDGKDLDHSKVILYPKELDSNTRHELMEKIRELDVDFEYEEYR